VTTVADLVARTEDLLYGPARGLWLETATAVGTSDTTIAFGDDVSVAPVGSHLSIGWELALVRRVDTANRRLEVRRGWRGTTPEAVPAGTLCGVNPRFPPHAVATALRDEIASWGQRIFRPRSVTVEVPTSGLAPLPPVVAGAYGVLEARVPSDRGSWARVPAALERDLPGDVAAGGLAVVVRRRVDAPVRMVVTLAVPLDLTAWAPEVDVEAQVGVPPSAVDVPPIGAAARLTMAAEVPRTDSTRQGEPGRAAEVPPGARIGTANALWQLRARRLAEEGAALQSRWAWTVPG
jgi:hypothetical protein